MALKKDLTVCDAREALLGKRKWPVQAIEEREFCRIRKGQAIPRVSPPLLVEKVRDTHPDLPIVMTSHFLLRSAGEGSRYYLVTAQDRIRRALVL